jgi:hypothetical protein
MCPMPADNSLVDLLLTGSRGPKQSKAIEGFLSDVEKMEETEILPAGLTFVNCKKSLRNGVLFSATLPGGNHKLGAILSSFGERTVSTKRKMELAQTLCQTLTGYVDWLVSFLVGNITPKKKISSPQMARITSVLMALNQVMLVGFLDTFLKPLFRTATARLTKKTGEESFSRCLSDLLENHPVGCFLAKCRRQNKVISTLCSHTQFLATLKTISSLVSGLELAFSEYKGGVRYSAEVECREFQKEEAQVKEWLCSFSKTWVSVYKHSQKRKRSNQGELHLYSERKAT